MRSGNNGCEGPGIVGSMRTLGVGKGGGGGDDGAASDGGKSRRRVPVARGSVAGNLVHSGKKAGNISQIFSWISGIIDIQNINDYQRDFLL